MLIEFTVGNFRSFKDPITLSMVAANTKARDPRVNENNTIFIDKKLTLLTSGSVFGANASGKSNLVRALAFMQNLVLTSSKESQSGEPLGVIPFLLNTETIKEPSFFQVIFWHNNFQYRYGFEANREKIVSEWLFSVPTTKEATLFVRENSEIKVSAKFKEGNGLEPLTRSNALFLSVAAQFNGQISQQLINWFRHIGIVSGLDDIMYRNFTVTQFAQGILREKIIELIRKLDLSIVDIFHEKVDKSQVNLPMEMPDEIKKLIFKTIEGGLTAIKTIHKKWDKGGKPTETAIFDLGDESDGTQKLFFLLGPILDTLENGRVLIIDEMEARLHPLMTRTIIGLFSSPKTNPKRAQLIFTTHDTNLLSNKLLRRDQIWFIEKDRFEASHLYSLVEIKVGGGKVRNDASFENDYLLGRYGAIPILGDIKTVVLEGEQGNDKV
jgi:AAA15 family ATPase/GTPase